MNPFAHFMLLTCIPVILLFFYLMPRKQAVLCAFLYAWMFLPNDAYYIPFLPNYGKTTATVYGVLLAVVLIDHAQPIFRFKPSWVDIPMALWCISPLFTSLHVGLGLWDGMSGVLYSTIAWGMPYFIGRCYFSQLQDTRLIVVALFIAGLVYAPLCWYEIRMSPQLHNIIYGQHAHDFTQTFRGGGWRPTVFMHHGLMVAMFMCVAAMAGIVVWKARIMRSFWNMPIIWPVLFLAVTFMFCKSTYAIVLFFMTVGTFMVAYYFRTAIPVLLLVLIPPIYVGTRIADVWHGEGLVSVAQDQFGEHRAGSLNFRLRHEYDLIHSTYRSPVFGLGASFVYLPDGRVAVPDSLWIIAFARHGLLGVTAFMAMSVLPVMLFLMRIGRVGFKDPDTWPGIMLALIGVAFLFDNLMNAMFNPIFILILGALVGVAVACKNLKRVPGRTMQKQQVTGNHQPANVGVVGGVQR